MASQEAEPGSTLTACARRPGANGNPRGSLKLQDGRNRSEARRLGCSRAALFAVTFQAPGFYERRG